MSKPTDAAKAVIEVAKKSSKPVLASWMGGLTMEKAVDCSTGPVFPPTRHPSRPCGRSCIWSPTLATRSVVRNTARHPGRVPARPRQAARRVQHDPQRRARHAHREHVQGVARGVRNSGRQALRRPLLRRRRHFGSPDRLPGRDEGLLAADHTQDGRRRRGTEPCQRRRGDSGLRAHRGHGEGKASGRTRRRRHGAEDGEQPSRPRADRGRTARSDLRHRAAGGRGRHRGGTLPRSGAWSCRR